MEYIVNITLPYMDILSRRSISLTCKEIYTSLYDNEAILLSRIPESGHILVSMVMIILDDDLELLMLLIDNCVQFYLTREHWDIIYDRLLWYGTTISHRMAIFLSTLMNNKDILYRNGILCDSDERCIAFHPNPLHIVLNRGIEISEYTIEKVLAILHYNRVDMIEELYRLYPIFTISVLRCISSIASIEVYDDMYHIITRWLPNINICKVDTIDIKYLNTIESRQGSFVRLMKQEDICLSLIFLRYKRRDVRTYYDKHGINITPSDIPKNIYDRMCIRWHRPLYSSKSYRIP